MRTLISQDNSPSYSRRFRSPSRVLFGGISAICLACFGLLATTTRLEWQLPTLHTGNAIPALSSQADLSITGAISAPATNTRAPKQRRQFTSGRKTNPIQLIEVDFKSVALISSPAPVPVTSPRRPIKQPGGNIFITQLPYGHPVPVSSGGMPEFYKIVLEPKGKMTEHGLMQRKARPNFGYDHQDIFTGEVPDGAYVLHCQRSELSLIRAMCWRELQISDDQWVQYRFPRVQLKDWWKIEKKVRANIG